jgi:outer membrane protein OmpA-like peptidoglycan-associated protein
VGYDFPTYKVDPAFRYITHKGGIMGGLSVNRFWSHWGLQVDGDYIKNDVGVNLPPDSGYFSNNVFGKYASFSTTKTAITRMFFGAGPAYKYADPSNKFTVDVATMGGLGIVDGGEILALGIRYNGTKDVLAYHSGFDKAKGFAAKGQVRLNYFFTPNWGVHIGGYYLNHFKVQEAQKNTLFAKEGVSWSNISYYEEKRGTLPGAAAPTGEGYLIGSGYDDYRRWNGEGNNTAKINVSSFGAFAGITYRFGKIKTPAAPKPPKPEKIVEVFNIRGKVVLCNTAKPISDVTVMLKNTAKKGETLTTTTNAAGEFVFANIKPAAYTISGQKENYLSETRTVAAKDFAKNNTMNIDIELCMEKVDCGKSIILKNILYDLDKYFIREDAKPELDRLVEFMKENPSLKVELSSHTDSRASDAYNMTLSQNRAKAAVDYIVSQGISPSRLIAKGYGETRLLNKCANGVPCTEAEHQLNRRTEFKVICPE